MVNKTKIEFYFNNIISSIRLPLIYLLQQTYTLHQIITNICKYHFALDIIEDNIIILYDEEHNVIIDSVQDLVENKTKKCKILFNEILFIFNNTKQTLQIEIDNFNLEDNFKQKIINECNTKLKLNLCEDNIVLHDIKNDKIIKTIKDIHDNNTKICKIIIIPINY
jgi:hypothetical protein